MTISQAPGGRDTGGPFGKNITPREDGKDSNLSRPRHAGKCSVAKPPCAPPLMSAGFRGRGAADAGTAEIEDHSGTDKATRTSHMRPRPHQSGPTRTWSEDQAHPARAECRNPPGFHRKKRPKHTRQDLAGRTHQNEAPQGRPAPIASQPPRRNQPGRTRRVARSMSRRTSSTALDPGLPTLPQSPKDMDERTLTLC